MIEIRNFFIQSRVVLLTIFSSILLLIYSCGLPSIGFLDPPNIPEQDLDDSTLFFDHTMTTEDDLTGYHIYYKFYIQSSSVEETNLDNLLDQIDGAVLTPSQLQNSYQFFPLSTNSNQPSFKPTIPLTLSNKSQPLIITMDFTELINQFLIPDINLEDFNDPFFLITNAGGTPVTTFNNNSQGIISFYRGVLNQEENKLYRFSDIVNYTRTELATQSDLNHLNLSSLALPFTLEIVFFIFSYGNPITEAEFFSRQVHWGTIKDFYTFTTDD